MFFRHGDSEFFLFPRLVARRKTSSSISLTSLILTISLISLCLIVCNACSVFHIMLFPGHKLSSSLVAFKFVYIMRQLHYSLVVQPLLRNMLDPPLVDYEDSLNNLVLSTELIMKIGHR